MKTIKLLKRLVTILIIALVAIHVILSFFFYEEIMFRSRWPTILGLTIIVALLGLGCIKYLAGDSLPRGLDGTYFLVFVIIALLIFILITGSAHQRQVRALTELIKRLEK